MLERWVVRLGAGLAMLQGEREHGGLREGRRTENQRVVDRLSAKLVLHDAEPPARCAGQHVVQQRSLAGPKESSHDRHGQPTAQAGAALGRHDLRVGQTVVDVPAGVARLAENAHPGGGLTQCLKLHPTAAWSKAEASAACAGENAVSVRGPLARRVGAIECEADVFRRLQTDRRMPPSRCYHFRLDSRLCVVRWMPLPRGREEMSSTATKPKASQHHVPLLSLSSEYLAGCTLVGDVSAPSVADPAAAEPREAPPAAADGEDGNFHCGVSRATFDSAEALREHYHTDWYRFNLKRAQRQLAPVRPQHRHTAPSAQAKPPLEHEKA